MARWLPSREHLRQLRAQGIFSWSSVATRSVVVAAVCGVCCFSTTWLQDLYAFCSQSKERNIDLLEALSMLKRSSVLVFVSTAVFALLAGVGISLIQTRGAVSRALVRVVRKRERSRNPLVAVVALFVGLNLAVCLEYVVAPRLLKVIGGGQDLHAVPAYIGNVLHDTAKLVVVGCVVLAVVLLFVSRLAFLVSLRKRTHQMTGDKT